MKGFIWGLIFLLAAVSVSATYFPEPGTIFEYKSGKCYENGSMIFNLTHEGNMIFFSDVNFTIESEDFSPLTVTGIWLYPHNYVINQTYIENDFFGKSRMIFKTTNNMFTEGKYIVTLSWKSNSLYYDHINFAIECPGVKCKNNDGCISQQKCVNQTCQWLKCDASQFAMGHTCFPKCDDYNSCTQDYYIDGKCVYVKIDNCLMENSWEETNILKVIWNWLKSKY